MLIREVTDVIERFAPLAWQESYDNAGLIVGRPDDEVHRALLAVDVTDEVMADIDKNTVDFRPNFDETILEPTVLPTKVPLLLVNGTSGFAVGMATNIPPHNLKEIIAAVVKIIDNIVEENRDTEIEEILKIIKGPDFPTGGMILGTRGIEEAYRTGRGKIRVRAVTDIETMPNGKSRIIVSELPYMVNKARLIEKIAELVRDKKIDGITDLSDQSSREGMRVVIELRRDANANVILNQLYKHTQLQDTFGVIMLALVGNEPKVMNLMEMLNYYLKHQEEVVTRRTQYELNKAEERAHILKGLLIALDNIDEVIKIIRGSQTVQIAKSELMELFGLTDVQSQAIVDMRLRALTGLEREKLEAEYKALMEQIEHLRAILADRKLLLGVIKEEILEMYFNTTFFGNHSTGIRRAARNYFGIEPKQLSLMECAVLAGLPNAPTDLNPYNDMEACRRRRDLVLENMHDQGFITGNQLNHAKKADIVLR